MDQLWYAQFNNISKYATEERLEFLKKLDVSYSIPDKSSDTSVTSSKTGYNCLHMAVESLDYECVKSLVERGADSLQQIADNGYTPLMQAMNNMKWNTENNKGFQELVGKLDEHAILNLLLSAHVKSGITLNPKSKDGLTHLHIACVLDHVEAVEFFLNASESVNLSTNNDAYWLPGYSSLHYAVRYSSVNVAEILLKQGADMNQKDARGVTPLQLLVERLLDTSDFMTMGKHGCCLPYKREIESLESILKLLLKSKSTEHVNFIDDTGLSAFHVACILRDKSVAQEYLTQNLDVNMQVDSSSKLWPGWTPLHFAASTSIEAMKLLLQNKAKVNIKNAKGQTAFDLCMIRFSPDIVKSILSTESNFQNILLTDGSTKLLDFLWIAKNVHESPNGYKFQSFLQDLTDVNSSVPPDSPLWPGYTALHLSVLMNEKTKHPEDFHDTSGFPKDCRQSESEYNCRKEDEAAYMARIRICLEAGCSVTAKNADGQTPIHLAFNLLKSNVVDELLSYCKVNASDANNLSVLHIACAVGATTLVEKLAKRNKKTDLNRNAKIAFEWHNTYLGKPCLATVRANSTPLHVAVIFERYQVVKCLLDNDAEVYAKDSLRLTPIHLSMAYVACLDDDSYVASQDIARMLIWRTPKLINCLSKDHLSHLHVAAYADDADAIERLLKKGANVNVVFKAEIPDFNPLRPPSGEYSILGRFAGKTPLHVATRFRCENAVRALIQGAADIHKENPFRKYDTPLLGTMENVEEDFVEHFVQKLKRQNLGVGPIADNGVTLLHFACARFDLKWAKCLLKNGADPNARVLRQNKYSVWSGSTPLHVMLENACTGRKKRKNFLSLIKRLLDCGADVTILNQEDMTPLYSAYYSVFPNKLARNLFHIGDERKGSDNDDDDDDLDEEKRDCEYYLKTDQQLLFLLPAADLMLKSQKSYDVNPACDDGFTHFHYACLRNSDEIVSKFLDNGIDVNHSTYPLEERNPGFTPLHFAMAHKCKNVARLLIERGANVKAEDARGNTPLHVAVKEGFIDTQIIVMLLNHGADINAVNLQKFTPVDLLMDLQGFTLKQLKFFLKHGSIMDVLETSGYIGCALKNTSTSDLQAVFKAFIKSCDLRKAVEKGFNAISNIVAVNQTGQLTLEFYLDAIQQLIDMGYDIDQQNEEGESALHEAAIYYNLEAVKALLLLGSDVNIIDCTGDSPLNRTVVMYARSEDPRDIEATTALASYVWRMKFIGLDINKSNNEALVEADEEELLGDLQNLESSCKLELAKMTGVMIDESMNVKDFLLRVGGKHDYSSISLEQHQFIDSFFKQKDMIRQEFPFLGGLLMAQYNKLKKAIIRSGLLELAGKSIVSLCKVDFPVLCLQAIFQYFKNDDLNLLIDATKKRSVS